jgi:hypothetical protein
MTKPKISLDEMVDKLETSGVLRCGWRVDHGGGEPTHVYPENDLRPHVVDAADGIRCWCRPNIVDDIIVHNAMDGREYFERGERKPS